MSTHRHYWIKEKINGSKVHKALILGPDTVPGNTWYAIKVVDIRSLADIDQKVRNEVDILRSLMNYSTIVTLTDVLETDLHYYLVMEYMGGGDVFDRIVKRGMYPQAEARVLAHNLLSPMRFVHSCFIAHRDLKPQNMLFQDPNNNTDFKVAGFSFAKKIPKPNLLLTRCGTPTYVSPEVLQGKPYDEKVDMWSIGVILYVVLVCYPPFLEESQERQSQKIMTADYQFYDDDWRSISQEAQDLIRRLLVIDPAERLSATQALEHSWIKREISSTYFGGQF
jgi:calcium/calmodulin-dependent protein kinase I